jgi:hypothetical protein
MKCVLILGIFGFGFAEYAYVSENELLSEDSEGLRPRRCKVESR